MEGRQPRGRKNESRRAFIDRETRVGLAQQESVDGDEDELDKEANDTHDGKADGGSNENLLILLGFRLVALLYQTVRVVGKGLGRLGDVLVHKVPGRCVSKGRGEKGRKKRDCSRRDVCNLSPPISMAYIMHPCTKRTRLGPGKFEKTFPNDESLVFDFGSSCLRLGLAELCP